jgi:ribosomal protein S18 acetylase RimI-like enzyme
MDEITIHRCAPGDEGLFERIGEEVFDDPIDRAKLTRYLSLPGHHLLIAIEKGVIVGQLTALSYQHPENRPGDLYIDEVGVSPSARRRGVATWLMEAAFALGRDLGCAEAWLGTEIGNRDAQAFYESLGREAERVMYYTFKL